MKKKIAVIILAGVSALALAACGGGKNEEASTKEHVYKAEEVIIEEVEDKNSISSFSILNERMYLAGVNWKEADREAYIVSRSFDGSDSSTTILDMKDNQSINFFEVDTQGNYYMVLNEYFEDSSDPENYIWRDDYYLLKVDAQGKELWKQPLKGENAEDYYNVKDLRVLADDRIALLDSVGLSFYDGEGQPQKKIKLEAELNVNELFQLEDGTLVVNAYKSETNKNILCKLNPETGALSEEYEIPSMQGGSNLYLGKGYDFLLSGSYGIYGYNLGDETATELMNYVDSDVNTTYVFNIVPINASDFYGMLNDAVTGETTLMRFSKVDPKDVVDKKVLTLACNALGWDVRNQVIAFNKSNQEYRIQIKDYSIYNTEENYEAGITKLNTDIASGNVPDILILENGMPIESYISKGLFEDLYTFIDNDSELDRSNYFPNVLKTYETNGKLYQMIPSFNILTVVGKQADVGAENGWTLEELNQVMASKPEDVKVFANETRSSVLNYSMQMSSEQFIDWETGKCQFNTAAFIELLEFLKQFPEKTDDVAMDDSFWRSYDALWRDDKVLLNVTYLDSFSSYNYMKEGTFGDEITFKGFPAENRKGSAIIPNLNMVMSSKSKNKDGAWQFMRYFISDEYQNTIEYGWPLNMKRLDYLEKKAKERPTYEDENGNIVEYDQTYFIGDIEIPIPPMTQEGIDKVLDFVKSVEQPYAYNQSLINIIEEEATPYFAGQKRAEEVAEIIQSRVQIYVNENR